MIYTHNIQSLARMCRDYWCCEYVIVYIGSADEDASDCELMVVPIL